MNRAIIYMAGIVLLLLFLGSVVFFGLFPGTSGSPQTNTPVENPFGGTGASGFPAPSGGTGVETPASISTQGGSVKARDFLKDPDVVKVTPEAKFGAQNEPYYLLGSLPYGYEGTVATTSLVSIPDPVALGYEIQYLPSQNSFSIFIYREPIEATREKMAADLAKRIGVYAGDLCSLFAIVRVAPIASPLYGDKNVGFPDCPGATEIPD
jgi:hypothetical protein